MASTLSNLAPAPSLRVVLEYLKPVTWFPPMWAFLCGAISSGAGTTGRWPLIILGVLLAGPLVCACSQAVNDWYDRHVDAINEPQRPIPSGRLPGRWGWYLSLIWTALSLAVATLLGTVGFAAAVVGLVLAWLYSAPPLRLKSNGWWGNAACGLCYEGLPWITGAAILLGSQIPNANIFAFALLYSIGAHGIMTLNDFKSIQGDRQTGVNSLPVQLGADRAARVACWFMALPQLAVVIALFVFGQWVPATIVAGLLLGQLVLMRRFLADPIGGAIRFSAFGVLLYVLGMMCSAFALRALNAAAL
jgi:chlorophyll synthase